MLKIETDRHHRVSLNMAVTDVLETRISTHASKGQKSQNYLNHDWCRQNENDIPVKYDTVTENWAKN